ncbi:conoporin-Cn1-like [Siniperca chuatsi]|uniref:conoporin-Cn1-like n=1 Tax=Siniperca chuatsi TaxID=119488 RepID=UPI001CE0624C|nr:conoporin-Cn1-like [Siniperca chuatsi]
MPRRQCTIELENKCSAYTLCNPSWSIVSGSCAKAFPPTLGPSESGSSLFIKTTRAACGSVGVLTYDLQNESTKKCDGKMAIMFSVPYDFNAFSNWYAVGVFDENKVCDSSLFKEMYYNTENGFVRGQAKHGGLTYKGEAVTIRATMSDSCTPVIKIQAVLSERHWKV